METLLAPESTPTDDQDQPKENDPELPIHLMLVPLSGQHVVAETHLPRNPAAINCYKNYFCNNQKSMLESTPNITADVHHA
jgi:hypothetical protein